MGIANRVINILVLVVAIAAAVFGVMLFNKREDVAKGRELMAKSIADSAAKLIAGETVAEKKKYAVSPEDMAISKTSQQLATPLKRLDDAVKHSLDQREKMAKDIVKIADLVNEGESGISDRRLNEYAQNAAEMEQVMQKIGARVELFSKFRVTMIDILQNANNKLKMDELDSSKTDKKNPDMDYVQKRFGDISDKGENALNRSDAYGKSLVKIATMFELESPELSGDDYETKLQEEMVGLKTYVEGHQALVREKEDLEAKNKELEGTKEKLLTENEEAQKTIETQKKSLELKEKKAQIDAAKIAKLEEALSVFNKSNDKKKKDLAKRNASGTVEEEVSNEVSNTTLLKQVLGKVVYADPSQNFVVIDLGKKYEINHDFMANYTDKWGDFDFTGIKRTFQFRTLPHCCVRFPCMLLKTPVHICEERLQKLSE